MAATPSVMVELGTPVPEFELPNCKGGTMTLRDVAGSKAVVIAFICNHCPFVKHVAAELAKLARDYESQGVTMIAISSNDVATHPDDSPELMAKEAEQWGWTFPYLYDETQEVAKAYHAACTPDFFVYDGDLKLAYRGQLDDSRPGNDAPVTGRDLRAALDAVLAGRPVEGRQLPSMGCNVKWKPGNEPAYA